MPNAKKTMYALLVGINQYNQKNIRNLNGCINDVEGIEAYLESYCSNNSVLQLKKHILRNDKATRKTVISGFNLFKKAKDGDICIFYFSGHGAKMDAPKEFWNESDNMLECIVCYSKDGSDNLLIDKELSFLIEKTIGEKAIHFVAISDSCHAGSNTKTNTSVKSIEPNINKRKLADFLGRSTYNEIKNEQGELIGLNAPIGKHFKLSACTHVELAKERALGTDFKIRGVFTHVLLETLKENGGNLSYNLLMNKVRLKSKQIATKQSPQLETIGYQPIDKNRLFLNGLLEKKEPQFQISFTKTYQWRVNVGELFGINIKDEIELENGRRLEIIKTYPNTSKLANAPILDSYEKHKVYNVKLILNSSKKLNLHFSESCNEIFRNTFQEILKDNPPTGFSIKLDKSADYRIWAINDTLALTHIEERIPVFSRIYGLQKHQIKLFINLLEQVAEWHRVLDINNPKTRIAESHFHIQLSEVERPYLHSNPDMGSIKAIADWHSDIVMITNIQKGIGMLQLFNYPLQIIQISIIGLVYYIAEYGISTMKKISV